MLVRMLQHGSAQRRLESVIPNRDTHFCQPKYDFPAALESRWVYLWIPIHHLLHEILV